ncbi:MAG: glycosyltransferase family 2 protein [Candidatus Thorarchaeota archaeon]|jgi:GT2 family glycosyltransferase
MGKVTAVFTSCGRFNLLKKTLESFIKFNTHRLEKIIIIENSGILESEEVLERMVKKFENKFQIIVNETNIGQVSSIDKAYSFIDTDYIFHSEDDWEFFDYGFIEKSIDVLESDDKILNINLRVRFDGERGSMHPLEPFTKQTKNGIIYYEYKRDYLGEWHGFSWNPGLRRLSDYDLIKPYITYTNEQGVGQKYKELDYRSGCLEKFYCRHIGQNSVTPKSNM